MVKLIGKKLKSSRKRRHNKIDVSAYDVVCIGRPAQDTILVGDIFKPVCKHGVCHNNLPLGLKLDVDDLSVTYGGNALNASVTFARQSLSTALICQLGNDNISKGVIEILDEEGIDDSLVYEDEDVKLAQSTILVAPNGERTILKYRGSDLKDQALLAHLENVETRWLYLSSLGSIDLLKGAIRHAKLNQIRVAFNPGGVELANSNELKLVLQDVDTLIMNKQEAENLFGNLEPKVLCRAAGEYVKTAIITDGPNGSYAFDGKEDYFQPISADVKVVDRNGAGDAFASGVISSLAWGMDLKNSLEFGAKNSTSVVSYIGAHQGILKRSGV